MTFLSILGWPIPAVDGAQEEESRTFGGVKGSAWTNRPFQKRQGLPRVWKSQAFTLTQREADTLEGLLAARSHNFKFERDAFSSSGYGPEAGVTNNAVDLLSVIPGIPGQFGPGGFSATWDLGLRERWTVFWWMNSDNAATVVHKVARSDGAKWENGVRNDALSTTELTVAPPAVAFDTIAAAVPIANLIVLPFEAEASFIEAFYRWTTAQELEGYVPFDGDFDDKLQGSGTAIGSPVFVRGRVGQAVDFDGVDDGVDYPLTLGSNLAAETKATWSAWVNLDAFQVNPPDSTLFDIRRVAGGMHQFLVQTAPGGNLQFVARPSAADTQVQVIASGILTLNTWMHLAISVDLATRTVRFYRDGILRYTEVVSGASWPTGSWDGTTSHVAIGYDPTSVTIHRTDGRIDETRFRYDLATIAELRDEFSAGRDGRRYFLPQPCSDLKRLLIQGDMTEWEEVEVEGDLRQAQSIVQHGAKTTSGQGVWGNNNRSVRFELHETRPRGKESVAPKPAVGWILDRPGVIEPIFGTGDLATAGVETFGPKTGPFQFGEARLFSNTSTQSYTAPLEVGELLDGLQRCSVLAWVNPATLVDGDIIISLDSATASVSRFELLFNALDNLVLQARSDTAVDGATTFAGSWSSATDRWSLVGGFVDFQDPSARFSGLAGDARMGVFQWDDVEGLRFETSGELSFSRTTFNPADAGADNRIGLDQANIRAFSGRIYNVYLFPGRRLTPADVTRYAELGRRGIFR